MPSATRSLPRVLRSTMAQIPLRRRDDRITALAEITSELLRMDEPRKRFAGMMSGLDIRYDLGEGPPIARTPYA